MSWVERWKERTKRLSKEEDEIKNQATETLLKAADDIRLGHYDDAVWYMGMAFGLVWVLKKRKGGKA